MTDRILPPPYLVELRQSNFRFAIGGEHYYGEFWVKSKSEPQKQPDGTIRWVSRGGYGAMKAPFGDRENVTRKIGAEEAKYLNEKDGSDHLEENSETYRFNTKNDVVAAAIDQFKETFDPSRDVLVTERENNDDLYSYLILSAPSEIRQQIEVDDYTEQNKAFEQLGFACVPETEGADQ